MSDLRWHHNGVAVSTHVGPVSAYQPDRRRIQITTSCADMVLDMDEWRSLVQYISLAGYDPHAYEWLEREYDSGLVRDGIMILIELRDSEGNRVHGY